MRSDPVVFLMGPTASGKTDLALRLAESYGAEVTGVASTAKLDGVRALGADHVIDRREQEIAPAVLELTGGRGADCVYDPVGGAAYTAATRCVAHEGRILLIGGEPGMRAVDIAGATIRSVAQGVLGVAVIQAVLAGIGLLAIGVPYAGIWTLLVLFLRQVKPEILENDFGAEIKKKPANVTPA